jgi:hypothetical protein
MRPPDEYNNPFANFNPPEKPENTPLVIVVGLTPPAMTANFTNVPLLEELSTP